MLSFAVDLYQAVVLSPRTRVMPDSVSAPIEPSLDVVLYSWPLSFFALPGKVISSPGTTRSNSSSHQRLPNSGVPMTGSTRLTISNVPRRA